MELKLYNHIRRHFLKDSIDLFDKSTQGKIESFDASIGLDEQILEAVKKYLKDYNKFLESNNQEKVSLRYYQVMAMYFTEVFFRNRKEPDFQQFSKNALAYWMATGSGKTMIMHMNIFQFIEHHKGFKDLELIITTPGVNLIDQHEREVIPLIEYLNKTHRNKIRYTIDTTSALTNKPEDFFNFPDDNRMQRLILVDEAHIGLGKSQKDDEGEFFKLRKKLNIKHSFLFEYSATFHNISSRLEREYSDSIIYDYNYNLFYKHGYGKDFYFQKISEDILQGNFDDNLERNLSVIEDKLKVFLNLEYKVKDLFNAEAFPDRPLIAFMGNTVNVKRKGKLSKEEIPEDELSDISAIVNYFANIVEIERQKYKKIFNGQFNGQLKLTRNPQADDEILLSYGEGDYWGIINVGNGLNFINNIPNENLIKVTSTAVVISDIEKYLFKNIDKPQSPINVLIGSRKFAEGWNCFRVSVIGLINLGKTKGNKIIQIFGRGIRLKGLNNDGKRRDINHLDDYFSLKDNNDDNLKKLETLCVFSLQRSYLETFTSEVCKDLQITKAYDIGVKPNILSFDEQQLSFEDYKNDLTIFKLAKTTIDVKKVILYPKSKKIEYEYVKEGKHKKGVINNFSFKLDYRTDKNQDGVDIRSSLKEKFKNYIDYVNAEIFQRSVIDQSDEANISLYRKEEDEVFSKINISDAMEYIDSFKYNNELKNFDFDFLENASLIIGEEFVKKVRNKVNWHLNSSNYIYDKPLEQSTNDRVGDFIAKYEVVKSFDLSKKVGGNEQQKTESELNIEIKDFSDQISALTDELHLGQIGNHIYSPLLKQDNQRLTDDLKLVPDKLNAGERKFVIDLAEYINSNRQKFKGYKVYLMRNVDSLKSIGIYLNDDTKVFYPDFIMWLVSSKKVFINFVDPKGQLGMKDFTTEEYGENIRIADKTKNDTLSRIQDELKKINKKEFILNSFILLRDSSDLGKNQDANWKKENMVSKNIFRLNWHRTDEDGNVTDEDELVDGKTYLDWIVEKSIGMQ